MSLNVPSSVKFMPSDDGPLTEGELIHATQQLHIKQEPLFKRSEKVYADPELKSQLYSLFSFVPSPNAKPDKNGFYGFAKIRGSFPSIEESEQRAIYLTKYCDSYNKIYHVATGIPFPITTSSEYSEKINEVDIRAEAMESISTFVREASDKDKKAVEEINERAELLRKDCSEPKELDVLDKYIISRKKIADNLFVFEEYRKKMVELKSLILKAEAESIDLETLHPEVLDQYKQKYEKACEDCGINQSTDRMALMVKQYYNDKPNLKDIFDHNKV